MPKNGDRARIGVIGTGWWATESHLPTIKDHADADIVAICDTRIERLNLAAKTFGVSKVYSDYRDMLSAEILDGVIIVTPHATHFGIAKDCLDHDLHVLIEKPMTLFAKDARSLVETAEKYHRELIIGYPYHYADPNVKARNVIRSGEIGAVQYVTCSFSSNVLDFLSGGVTADSPPINYTIQSPSEDYNSPELLGGGEGHLQITHSAALMFFLTGLRAQRVHALMNNHGLAVDLVDTMTVEFENDALGMVGGTGNAGKNHRLGLAIYCEDGCYIADTLAHIALIRRPDGSEENLIPHRAKHDHHENPPTRNFIQVILGREQNGSPGEVGWRTVELLDAAYRSAHDDGRGVYINDLYDSE